MAKRKLSAEQRTSLREDLKKGVAAGKKTADLLREIAEKYKITTITARWYLKSVGGTPKRKSGRRGPGRPPGRRPGRPALGTISDSGLAKQVQEQSDKANEAKKIVPRWQKLVDKEAQLRRQALKVERLLEATASKASQLRNRISELVGS